MYLAIIVLPLLGSIVSGFFGRKVGVHGAQFVTCSSVIITTILAIVAFFEVGLNNIPVSIELFRWIDSESLNVLWGFHFDCLTVSMLIPVLIVSSLVHIYSIGYMSHDPRGRVRGKRVYGGKLSNSGELLKLKVPSYSWKTISGWSNYSGMVTSLKMSENKMDNRGSKSAILNSIVVKEQRVDGSWSIKSQLMDLRCTLWGSERNRGIPQFQQGVMLKSLNQTRSKQLMCVKTSTCNSVNICITLCLNSILSSSALSSAWLSLWGWSFLYNRNKERGNYWATMLRYTPHKNIPLLSNKLSFRRYSTTSEVREENFYEWFCGLTDGEGSFYIKSTGSRTFSFRFQLCLHKDDLEMLNFIQKTLGMGRIFTYRSQSYFDVTKQGDVARIIDIFNNYPLNTHKHLNFLDFKKAYELYVSNKERTSELVFEINTLKKGMNTKRSYFGATEYIKTRITPYWVLGFIEGESSFHILNKDYYPRFSIGQSTKDLALMEQLKDFFNSLEGELHRANLNLERGSQHQKDVAYLSINHEIDMVNLAISQRDFITNVFIPFLDNLTWHSKKEKDFQDWKAVLNIRNLGLHYTEKGVEVINLILSQMNSNRLSSKSRSTPVIDRALLQIEIEKLLMGGSNFEEKEDGRIFIKSLNRFLPSANIGVEVKDKDGLVLNTFASLSDGANYLGVSRSTVTRRLRKSEPLLVNDKLIYICTVEDNYY